YEEKMKQTQKRLERFDDEKRLLDEPIELPRKKVKDKGGEIEVPIEPVFLRLPQGIPKKPIAREGILFRFGHKPPTATALGFLDVSLALESEKVDPKTFVQEVLRLFPRKDPRMVPQGKIWEAPLLDSVEPPAEGAGRTFETYEFEDP